ncbi:MAG: NAD(P)-binding domain-containing protein [Bacteroidota bacterium]
MKTIGFIGGGRITRIFLNGFTNQGMNLDGVSVYDPNQLVLDKLKAHFPAVSVSSQSLNAAAAADCIFLAVHPPVMMETLTAIKPLIRPSSTIVSLAPKITIDKIESILGNADIARINPSASSYINQGINPISYATGMSLQSRTDLQKLMAPLGKLPEVEEPKIEAYAMISAMGHTYFWFQIQKLKELAIGFGMTPVEAEETIAGMMDGTVKTLFQSGLDYTGVTDLVPVKPLGAVEEAIKGHYDECLIPLFNKIKP